ncbi:MAG: serine/threonine-protein phosphatase [Planctomycetes bacterium]|nr:serine/threonine-protein phosphatase [Planctomycetota bacterium]
MGKQSAIHDSFGATDPGLKRTSNQDQLVIADLRQEFRILASAFETSPRRGAKGRAQARLLLVADGMGGMADGGVASTLVTRAFLKSMARRELASTQQMQKAMAASARHCRKMLTRHAAGKNMGTTLTAAMIRGDELCLLHIGDSRCYVLSGGKLQRLTTDHTIAQKLSDEGAMSAAEAAASPFAHVLWNSISSSEKSEMQPQLLHRTLKPKDVLVLCSDGLTKHVPDKRIAQILKAKGDACFKAAKLVEEARAGGGTDNITVVVSQGVVAQKARGKAGPAGADMAPSATA